jgi:hypothetical protein
VKITHNDMRLYNKMMDMPNTVKRRAAIRSMHDPYTLNNVLE